MKIDGLELNWPIDKSFWSQMTQTPPPLLEKALNINSLSQNFKGSRIG